MSEPVTHNMGVGDGKFIIVRNNINILKIGEFPVGHFYGSF